MKFRFFKPAMAVLVFVTFMSCQQNNTDEQQQGDTAGTPEVNEQDLASSTGEVTDDELRLFVAAVQEMEAIGQSIQPEMANAVTETGLTVQRYGEIQRATQDPNQSANATAEEMDQYRQATEKVTQIQQTAQQEMEAKVEEEGLSLERYQVIATQVQNDPALQQKFQTIQQELN